jgi:aspartate/methionine/tyrosine aminotransferase
MINSPNNPTGAVLNKDSLESIATIAEKHDLLVLSDEIYSRFVFDDNLHISFASFPGMFERTITVNGFSKSHSMTGWRLGYVAAPRNLSSVMKSHSMTGWRLGYVAAPRNLSSVMLRAHQYSVTSATSFAQYGGVEAYAGKIDETSKMLAEFDRRRRLLTEGIERMGLSPFIPPKGGFYAFPSIQSSGLNSEAFSSYLLDNYYVATVPGSAFGPSGEGFVRLAYSTSYKDVQEAIIRLEDALKSLT